MFVVLLVIALSSQELGPPANPGQFMGFGSLDAENGSGTLDQVLGVLSSLVSANRAVGLISHVQLVQDAVPNGFYVRKRPQGATSRREGPCHCFAGFPPNGGYIDVLLNELL
jgi:hypothetical protein